MNLEKFTKTIQDIFKANPNCAISGSLALNFQGVKTRRYPKDLDIYLPYEERWNNVEDIVCRQSNSEDNDEHSESESNYNRDSFNINGILVDVFTPISKEFELEVVNVKTSNELSYVRCVYYSDIIKMKIEHAFGSSYSKYKHKDDIVFMMSNIQ